jgi:hypothetical protein
MWESTSPWLPRRSIQVEKKEAQACTEWTTSLFNYSRSSAESVRSHFRLGTYFEDKPKLLLFLCFFVCLSFCLPVCLSVSLSLSLSVCQSVSLYLSVCLFVCLSVCLVVWHPGRQKSWILAEATLFLTRVLPCDKLKQTHLDSLG